MKRQFKTLDDFLGTHFIYTYDNGWEYEWYAKNDHTVDYRIHGGMVKGRWGIDNEDVISEEPYDGMPDDIRSGKYFDENYKRVK